MSCNTFGQKIVTNSAGLQKWSISYKNISLSGIDCGSRYKSSMYDCASGNTLIEIVKLLWCQLRVNKIIHSFLISYLDRLALRREMIKHSYAFTLNTTFSALAKFSIYSRSMTVL